MSEEQLSALLAKLLDDEGLQEKFTGAAGLDDALAMAQEAGFDVSKADWLKYQAKQTLQLGDEELERGVAGGLHSFADVQCNSLSGQRCDSKDDTCYVGVWC